MEAIELQNFGFHYPGSETDVLRDITLSVGSGEFILLCGPTGSGKTTLLRNLKPEIAPHGQTQGSIRFAKQPAAGEVGFVMQNPDSQIVTDTAWHEMAFGLENMGLSSETIRRRVAETAHFFGIGPWYEKSVYALSGGQKQILNLAAVTAMQPDIILLDEPTAQLDPIAAKEFLQMLQRVNTELGQTVVLSEHRLDDVLSLCSRVLFLQDGRLAFDGAPQGFAEHVRNDDYCAALPMAAQLGARCGAQPLPLDVRQGRAWLQENSSMVRARSEVTPQAQPGQVVLEAKDVWFRYNKQDAFVLQGWELQVQKGSLHCIVGGNGSGKSTALGVLCGLLKPVRGRINTHGQQVGLLVQNPKAVFTADTLRDELQEHATPHEVNALVQRFGLDGLLDRHPYDLSGGEMQKAALAKLLLRQPDILLLDEPAKGLDAYAKRELQDMLHELLQDGKTIVLVTHDLEFAAQTAQYCSMQFNGATVASGPGKAFFQGNNFYTTAINRMTRGLLDGCVTLEDVQCSER